MKKRITVGLVLALALVVMQTRAQTMSGQPNFPYFVGAHAFNGSYEVFFPATANSAGTESSWQLTLGRALSRRWAVQLGVTYARKSFVDDPSYTRTTLSGQYEEGAYRSERGTFCLPVLARYALVRRSRPRLQVDAVAGLTVVRVWDEFTVENRVNGLVVARYAEGGRATHAYLTAGLGLRYPFGRRFEGVLDWTYSRNLRAVPDRVHLAVVGNPLGLTRAVGLGLRYRFALKRKSAAGAGS